MTIEVVVAKYNEDVSWTKKLKHKVTIYNKNSADNHLFERNLLNYGKDAHTHLHHIVTNWYNLADYTIFLQGNPFEHNCETCVEFINSCDFKEPFYPIGPTYIRDNDQLIQQAVDYCKKMGIEYKLPFMFIGGMQCIVHRDQIKRNSLDFYVKLMESIAKNISTSSFSGSEHGNDPQIWALEYSWPTIFGVNERLTHKLDNCQVKSRKVLTGVSNNVAKNIDKIKVWANSFKKQTGGDVVLIAADMTQLDRDMLNSNQIKFHEVVSDPILTINDGRLVHTANWIESSDYDLYMVTDVFDVCFQGDPFEMFDHHDFYAASEGVLHTEEPWNMDVIGKAFPEYNAFIRPHEVVCSGVMGGRKDVLVKTLRMQQELVDIAPRTHDIRDQSALNILIYKGLIPNCKIFKPNEGWAVHCSLSGPTFQHIEWGLGKAIDQKYGLPHLEGDKLVHASGKIYKIAHQYNRIPEWNEKIIAQYV